LTAEEQNQSQEQPTEEMEATQAEVGEEQEEQSQTEAEKWKQEAEENHQAFLRARADLENYRRRVRKELEETAKYAPVPLVESLLPVLDNMERALSAGDDSSSNALYEGVEMVYRQLVKSLEEHGLQTIQAEGAPFNPHEHNAVMQVEAEDVEPGTVVEVLQQGYKFRDRVIRPAMVKVSS
jgi:molecular chaperone GrpE